MNMTKIKELEWDCLNDWKLVELGWDVAKLSWLLTSMGGGQGKEEVTQDHTVQENNLKKKYIYIYRERELNHFSVYLKLTQYRKSTILQLKKDSTVHSSFWKKIPNFFCEPVNCACLFKMIMFNYFFVFGLFFQWVVLFNYRLIKGFIYQGNSCLVIHETNVFFQYVTCVIIFNEFFL